HPVGLHLQAAVPFGPADVRGEVGTRSDRMVAQFAAQRRELPITGGTGFAAVRGALGAPDARVAQLLGDGAPVVTRAGVQAPGQSEAAEHLDRAAEIIGSDLS